MEIEGVTRVGADPEEQRVVVTFDDTKTNLDKIMRVLTTNGFPPQGEPKWLPLP